MKDYSKKCWSCGGKEVLPIKDYFECQDCGATMTKLPAVPQRQYPKLIYQVDKREIQVKTHAVHD